MVAKLKPSKNPAAVALGRRGRKKDRPAAASTDTSDHAVLALLKRLKATKDPSEVRQLSHQLERAIFHKQFQNA